MSECVLLSTSATVRLEWDYGLFPSDTRFWVMPCGSACGTHDSLESALAFARLTSTSETQALRAWSCFAPHHSGDLV
jgi:hypothetical protein